MIKKTVLVLLISLFAAVVPFGKTHAESITEITVSAAISLKNAREFPIPIVFVTHDVLEAYSLADKIIIYVNGSVAQSGTPKEVFTNPACKEVEQLVNARERLIQSVESLPCINKC